jgi:hypothetical protein
MPIRFITPSVLSVFVALGLHGLAEAVALAVHLEDFTAMGQTIQQCRRHPITLEDTPPLAERQVARHQDAASLVPIREHLEQQLGTTATERQVTQFVDDQQIDPIQLSQHSIQTMLLLRFLQLHHQIRRCHELHASTQPTQ